MLAGVPIPERLLASDAPTHQRTCDRESGHVVQVHNSKNTNSDDNIEYHHSDDNDDVLACRLTMG